MRILFSLLKVICILISAPINAQDGMNLNAVPSLNILGVSKGGSSDLYALIVDLHSGFPPHATKELKLDRVRRPATAARAKCRLMCHENNRRCHRLRGVETPEDCYKLMFKYKMHPRDYYTISAMPLQYANFNRYAGIFQRLNKESNAKTLFLLALRDPITAIPSLYNHWVVNGINFNASLEEVLEGEFELLGARYIRKVVKWMFDASVLGPTYNGTLAAQTYSILVHKFEQMNRSQKYSFLLLHLYVPQLIGYLDRVHDMKENLLIVKSEYYFEDRFKFFYQDLLPFLHPPNSTLDFVYRVRSRAWAEDNHTEIMNQKVKYIPEAKLSDSMKTRLRQFFAKIPIEPFLFKLQQKSTAAVVPRLMSGSVRNSTWAWMNATEVQELYPDHPRQRQKHRRRDFV